MSHNTTMKYLLSLGAACIALLILFGHAETAPPALSGDEFFEKEVRPILVELPVLSR